MTDAFGIPDLGALRHPVPEGAGTGTPAEHEVPVTTQNLEQIIQDSNQVATLLLVTSSRVQQVGEFLAALRREVDARSGAVRLAMVDADTQAEVAQALQVRQLPTLLLLLKGQLQPIVEQVLPAAEIGPLLDQVVQVAQQQGVHAAAAGDQEEGDAEEEPLAPLVQSAYDAIESGDLQAAVAAYEEHLQQNPADAEAKAGLATVRLMDRTKDADLQAARTAAADHPDDLEAQLQVADLDMIGGHVDDAFARLLGLLRGADAETKDTVRTRLLELFEVAGPEDPRVPAARKRLANLLY